MFTISSIHRSKIRTNGSLQIQEERNETRHSVFLSGYVLRKESKDSVDGGRPTFVTVRDRPLNSHPLIILWWFNRGKRGGEEQATQTDKEIVTEVETHKVTWEVHWYWDPRML